jgi:hypothetical protein
LRGAAKNKISKKQEEPTTKINNNYKNKINNNYKNKINNNNSIKINNNQQPRSTNQDRIRHTLASADAGSRVAPLALSVPPIPAKCRL